MRFTGSTNTQIIQNDDQGYPLYASAGCLSENRNLDICMADFKAVVPANSDLDTSLYTLR